MDKYHPGYYGKVGMRHFHMTRNQSYCPTVNLDKLWTLVSEQTRKIYATKKDNNLVPVIDTLRAGYGKVLGKGRLPDQPVIIKARYVSRRAEEKIKKVGDSGSLVRYQKMAESKSTTNNDTLLTSKWLKRKKLDELGICTMEEDEVLYAALNKYKIIGCYYYI
ncbi:9012_t:CDS:2 [Entrophospora sp. SA101]|nr:4626_t:CDS:2 [Entrophospora sp. SA101]CAJ0755237.1 9012_t:CDS:2 [Entrophospora sp. SA101]